MGGFNINSFGDQSMFQVQEDDENIWGKNTINEPGEVSTARARLLNKAGTTTREIADLSPLEKLINQMQEKYATSGPSETRQVAVDAAKGFAEGGDPTESPWYKAIEERLMKAGDELLRNSSRGLQQSGNDPLTSSKGRDALGREATDVQAGIMSAAAPLLEAAQGRKFAAIGVLDQLATMESMEKIQKMDIGDRAGSKLRMIKQMAMDEDYNRRMEEIATLQGVLGTNPGGQAWKDGAWDRQRKVSEDWQRFAGGWKDFWGGTGSMMGGGA